MFGTTCVYVYGLVDGEMVGNSSKLQMGIRDRDYLEACGWTSALTDGDMVGKSTKLNIELAMWDYLEASG